MSKSKPKTGTRTLRCAIYTRKSSEEGLEQDFNSLDAQRESCEAFILSQKHAGWAALPAMYDDGGVSGGTMERPALKRLLADIRARKVDTVVVYKVDRLTRSLADFAKIVEAFDSHKVSFVSVTQQFNTTTSMGRLTLNVLLSFAQFEREVTGERIRDKIAASKKKGLWMGDRDERHAVAVEGLNDLGEVGERPGQAIDLIDHDDVDPAGIDGGEQALPSRAVQGPTGEATVVVTLWQQLPTLMGLALDVGLTGLALGIQRVEVLLQARLGRLAGIDGTALSFLSHGA